MTKRTFKSKARRILDPIVSLMDAMGVPPFLVSLFGLAFSLYGAVVVAGGGFLMGAVYLLLSGACDVLDGDLARRRNLVSRFGAFIDSTFDRITEFAYFSGFLFYTIHRPDGFGDWQVAVILIALTGSVLTSYARARAEGLGLECTVGVMERPERIALLLVGLVLGYRILMAVITILAATSLYTFLQRVAHVHRSTRGDRAAKEERTPPASS